MSNQKPKPITITLKYYNDEKIVELPLKYDDFIKNICSMLIIQIEFVKTFHFYYQNTADLKVYFIKNESDYKLFLKTCSEKNAKVLNIKLSDDNTNNIIIKDNNNEDSKEDIKEISINNNINYKESFIEEEKEEKEEKINLIDNNINHINISKKNSENIFNNIDDDLEAIEFSMISENKNININKNENNINNININNNNPINKKIIMPSNNDKLNIFCNVCKHNKIIDVVYYCKDCNLFFCETCEIDLGRIHQHCYYKIKNKRQYDEMIKNPDNVNIVNQKGNFIQNLNRSNANKGAIIQNSVKEIISEGSKILGNLKTSITNFFNPNEIDDSNNPNEINNPYEINNYNAKVDNEVNANNENKYKSLVAQAKSKYNLTDITDDEIEKALIQHKGNIDDAVAMLLLKNDDL